MSFLTDRLADITEAIIAAVLSSETLENKDRVTVSNSGRDFLNAKSQRDGAIIVYPFPRITWPAPKTKRVVWTIGIIASGSIIDAAHRTDELLEVVQNANIVRWSGAAEPTATPTDFAVSEDPAAPKTPGYSITITEEHRS